MNNKNIQLASQIVNKSYIGLAQNSLNSRENMITTLLSQRQLPEEGWDDLSIELLLQNLASMDTNNFPGKVGVGERESRIYSSLVNKRNFHMGHGIGRSGDIAAIQPKAAGSSLILKLTKCLAQDALKIMGIQKIQDLLILPLATGMALSMVLLAFMNSKPKAKYVIWSRIDQKTCLKCIKTVNLIPVVVELKIDGDSLTTNTQEIENKIKELGSENVLCVLSTTSCFAPRVPDDVQGISKICQQYDINHLVNNAYGLQCKKITNSLNLANKNGRVDAVVQSTDKNFMVPVGGSIVFTYQKQQNNKKQSDEEEKILLQNMTKEEKKNYYQEKNKKINQNTEQKTIIDKISELYPGRASAAPITDLFITLLSMGKLGLNQLLQERQENLVYAKEKIKQFTQKHNEKLLETPKNTISLAITLKNYQNLGLLETENESENENEEEEEKNNNNNNKINQEIYLQNQLKEKNDMTQLGAILYCKRVMGSRILTKKNVKKVCGLEFYNYGAHSNEYQNLPFITVAVAIGMQKQEIDNFLNKLDESLIELKQKQQKKQ